MQVFDHTVFVMTTPLHQSEDAKHSYDMNPCVLEGYAAVAASGPKQHKSYKSSLVLGEALPDSMVTQQASDKQHSKKQEMEDGPLIPKEQICFDFTKGQCRRGSGCKFSHDVGYIIRVNSQEKGICFDFLKGACRRGVLCRFSHDLNNLKPMLDRKEQEEGKQRVIGGKHGSGKKKTPICYDFVKNNCAKGDSCRYSHDYTALYNQVHKRKVQSSEQANPNVPASQDTPVCIDYLRGNCSQGLMCTMSHVGKGDVPASAGLVAVPVPVPVAQHSNPETLDDLIARLKKMQYEESLMKREEPFSSGMSYPPPSMSQGARLMDAYYNANHHMQSPLRMNVDGYDFPMSPPVTHAEKARLSLRNQLLQEEMGSPMIGAGWGHETLVSESTREYSDLEQPTSPMQQSQDLHHFLSMQSIWSQE